MELSRSVLVVFSVLEFNARFFSRALNQCCRSVPPNSVINYSYPKRLLCAVKTLSIHHQITNGASLNICPKWSPWSRWKQNGSHESWKRFNIVGGKSLIYKTGWKCKKNWCGGNWLWEMEQNLCYLWNLSFGKKLFSRVPWKSIYQKSSDCGNRFLYSRPHGCQIWSFSYSLNFWFIFSFIFEVKFY